MARCGALDRSAAHRAEMEAALDGDTPLSAAGVSSQQAVRLAGRLSELSSVRLSATLVFEYPTPRAISGHLATFKGGAAAAGDVDVDAAAAA